MAHNSKGMGPNFVPAYQVSGIPYVTSSHGPAVVGTAVQKITFPQVTRFFVVNNIGSNILRVGFTENGVDGGPDESGAERLRWFQLNGGQISPRLEIRCKELYFRAVSNTDKTGFSLIAGLSGVPSNQFPTLTGSLLYSGSDGEPLGAPVAKFEGVG
tara:strand:- start:226 stop:696 length:471 start_codon:yes stop_codon:yes gene_type:complete